MENRFARKSILKKTLQVGGSTLASRCFGIVREILMTRYLGVGVLSDAFVTAFRIPNSLRKAFAEGALSGAFIPTLVHILKNDNQKEASKFMTLLFCFIEGILLLFCLAVFFNTESFLNYVVGGFDVAQMAYTVSLLRVLIFFIVFMSAAAIMAGALQSVNHFWAPSIAPIVQNIFFIGALLLALKLGLSIYTFSYFVLASGLVFMLLHFWAYKKLNFKIAVPDKQSFIYFKEVLFKFLPCIFSVSITEINLYIDSYLASFLPEGSVTLIYYAYRFIGIPLGVFATAFSMILLPYFSRISAYAPKRLSFFMYESVKLILYIMVPVALLMSFFAFDIFHTIFQSSKFPLEKVIQASHLLIAACIGLFFWSVNKILLNIYYALHDTRKSTIISIAATLTHLVLNLVFMPWLGATGLMLANSISGIVQTGLFVFVLHKYYHFKLYVNHFIRFLRNFALQLLIFGTLFYMLYKFIIYSLSYAPVSLSYFFLDHIGLWLWVGPLASAIGLLMLVCRKKFGIKLYFLD